MALFCLLSHRSNASVLCLPYQYVRRLKYNKNSTVSAYTDDAFISDWLSEKYHSFSQLIALLFTERILFSKEVI